MVFSKVINKLGDLVVALNNNQRYIDIITEIFNLSESCLDPKMKEYKIESDTDISGKNKEYYKEIEYEYGTIFKVFISIYAKVIDYRFSIENSDNSLTIDVKYFKDSSYVIELTYNDGDDEDWLDGEDIDEYLETVDVFIEKFSW